MIKAFLFDLDGVLTDTSEYHYLAWQRLADDEGLPFARANNEALRGVSRRESLNILLKGKQISEETAQSWMDRKNRYYVELVGKMTPADILPGALDLLKELRAAGIRVVIVSGSKNAPMVLERLQILEWMDLVADVSLVQHSKPAPDLFLAAAQRVGFPPQQCLVVEDAAAGIEAAIAAGMHSLGLGPIERVGAADLVLADLEDSRLTAILARFQDQNK